MGRKFLLMGLASLCLLMLVGCGSGEEATEAKRDDLAAEFSQMVQAKASTLELYEFLLGALPQAEESDASAMLTQYISVLNRDDYYWRQVDDLAMRDNDSIMEFYDYLEAGDDLARVKNEELRQIIQEAVEVGLKWYSPEGAPWTRPDYLALEAKFGDYAGEAYGDFLAFMVELTDPHLIADGGLTVSWDQLAAIIHRAEEFMNNSPDALQREAVEEYYEWYQLNYFVGLDNTPAFAYDTGVLLPEVKASYEKTISSYAGSAFAKNTEKYLQHLAANSYQEPYDNYDWLRENDLIVSYD